MAWMLVTARVPEVRYGFIALAALAGLFVIGLDQGQLMGAFMGQLSSQQSMVHELFHDVRHAAGFMCH